MSMRAGALLLLISSAALRALAAVAAGAADTVPPGSSPAPQSVFSTVPLVGSGARQRPVLSAEDSRLIAEVIERVRRNYVDDVDAHRLVQSAVRGMLASLDTHSAYLSDSEFEEIRLSSMGLYPGIGIEVVAADSAIKILRPVAGGPADRAGLRAGDLIVRIDDEDVAQDLARSMGSVRGRAGTTVRLTVRRPSTGESLNFVIKREQVEVHTVSEQMLPSGYGYARITNFSETTARDLNRAILQLRKASHRRIKGLVLDLRNNPGGVLEAAVAVADAFLDRGIIVTGDGRAGDARFEMVATPGDLLKGAPLVVLVNGGSASASEIVAGALKDHHRAQLVGHRTYGKGSVQTVMPLSQGGAIKLTTSRYFTPSGMSIHGKGIEPDFASAGDEHPPPELVGGDAAALLQSDSEITQALDVLQARDPHRHLATAATPAF